MSSGSVGETLPDTDHASEVVALHLAQHPEARRVLVVGPGSLGVCRRFLALPTVEKVTWVHPDPAYVEQLQACLPERFREGGARQPETPGLDPRTFLATTTEAFDLVVISMPNITSLVLNRYATVEFFEEVKRRLAPGGVVSLRISGPANYVAGELAYLGASAWRTMEAVFPRVVLKPSEESWLIASEAGSVTEKPEVLLARWARVPEAASVYPPERIPDLYPTDRIAFQMEAYRDTAARLGDPFLQNRDAHPKALVFALALAVRQATGYVVSSAIPAVVRGVPGLAVAVVLLYGLLRCLYVVRGRGGRANEAGLLDFQVLVFAAGGASMAFSVLLMFLYQARFGSLFLDIGVVTSLFMLGAFAGGLASEQVLARAVAPERWLAGCLAAHALPVVWACALPAEAGRAQFVGLFLLAGLFGGAYFPVAAHRMRKVGDRTRCGRGPARDA